MPLTLCVLLWSHPGQSDLLTDYESQVLALVPRHGGRVVSRVRNVAGEAATSLERAAEHAWEPCEVQVIELPDDDALAAYLADPERTARLDVRDRAIARTEILRVAPVG
ncbi:hypothetical protein [Cellulosimicrobium arenosum]|uniref:DUF1330 domain-containing protein n=1 Tax=Cellulosimicrobium arenosum TaxID=2708133 RepID=A0A927G7Q4_9MICO|nr:hypothetical protein [Cellulosimicrobium arenosum]